MLDVNINNTITMTRGDTYKIPLYIFTSNSELKHYAFFPNVNDKIFFAIMEPNQKFEDAIIKKVYYYQDVDKETGKIDIKMESTDTQYLTPGTYYYSVKLLRKSPWEKTDDTQGTVETVVDKTKFVLVD